MIQQFFVKKNIQAKKPKHQPPVAKKVNQAPDYTYRLLAVALLLSLIAFIPAFKAGFVDWDDPDYIANNLLIRSFSNFKELITVPLQGNYHPLTMLSLTFNYAISGMNAGSYHALNIIFHLLNVFLVFKFVSKLTNNNNIIAFAAALLFGVHPIHVESVAWVSERKDVLYTFFFLLGMISYLKFTDTKSKSAYYYSILWHFLSLASKPAAIVFPLVLLAIDYFRQRNINAKLLIEKLPFFILSGILTYLTLHAQTTVGATDTSNMIDIGKRIFFPFYGFMMYFFKMILPVNLVAFYPLPPLNEPLPALYSLSPVFFLGVAVLCWSMRKKYPVIAFGFLFYLINLALVLQFKVIGSAIIADRYTYVPYIGLFIIVGWLLDIKFKQNTSVAYVLLIAVGLIFTGVSYNQAKTWTSTATLWDNAIAKLPSEKAYANRARMFREEGQSQKALEYYNEAIRLNAISHDAYCNRGNIYFDRGQDSLALKDYNKALQIKPDYFSALDNRGALYGRQGRFDLALADINRSLQLKPDHKSAYSNRALIYFQLGQYENSLHDFQKFLTYEPTADDVINTIGVCYQNIGRHDLAVQEISRAISIDPQALYYLNRSYSYNALGKVNEARNDALTARQGGMQIPAEYAAKLGL